MNCLKIFIISFFCVIPASANENVEDVKTFAKGVVELISEKKWKEFSKIIHPKEGVKFSPYTYVRETAVTLNSEQFLDLTKNKKKLSWGFYEGSGEPIQLNLNEYYQEFLYKLPYAQSQPSKPNEKPMTIGSTVNNIPEVFSGESVLTVQFFILKDKEELFDSGGLTVVLKKDQEKLYVIGLVNCYWGP